MDFISHGLWGGIALGRSSRRSFWTALAFGVAPDVLSFGPVMVTGFVRDGAGFLRGLGHPPDAALIPDYVYGLYDVTHSLVVFAAVFALAWLVRRRPILEMGAWGLHVTMDIFMHSDAFFPTPFLWPLWNVHVDGVPWGHPIVFFPNVALLALLYAWFFYRRKKPG